MMVVNSFDLWQKDVFFSAAEEVQKSADIMESAYRLWIREKKDDICKELQAALSTAKWQLEEFQKAVRVSYKQCRDDSKLTRHEQFVSAIENQIHRVESSLQEAYSEYGKEPLRWVDLNEDERDDLAMFLAGSSPTSQSFNGQSTNVEEGLSKEDCRNETSKDVGGYCNGSECVIDIEEKVKPRNADARIRLAEKAEGTRRTWSSPNFSALRIIVPGDNEEEQEEKERLMAQIEATPKVKGTKPLSWMQRLTDHNQLISRTGCFQNPIRIPFTHPIKLTVSLMLMVFLLLPFVVYSS